MPQRLDEIVPGESPPPPTPTSAWRYFGMSEGFFLGLRTDDELMARRRQIGAQLKAIRPMAA